MNTLYHATEWPHLRAAVRRQLDNVEALRIADVTGV